MRACVAAAVLAVLSLTSTRAWPADLQNAELERLKNDLKRYHALVTTYCAGDDTVLSDVLPYDWQRLRDMVDAIDSKYDANRPWGDRLLRCGALLQTAAALKFVDEGVPEAFSFHLELATRHFRKGSEALRPFASRWFYAIARLFRSRYELGAAEQMLEMGREQLPGDALILYDSGTLAEMRATQWQLGPSTVHVRSLTDTAPLSRVADNRRSRVEQAAAWLRESVAKGPTELSRLHLGRVLMMRNEDTQALQVLQALRSDTTDRAVAYLALMFAGAVHERSRRLDDAARAYQQAVDCFPEGNSAYVAYSEVLQALQRPDDARKVLRDLLNGGRDRRDPWSWYFFEPPEVVRERMVALFQEGRR